MRLTQLVILIILAICAVHCGAGNAGEEEFGDSSRPGSVSLTQTCVAEWDPTWAQGSGANEWWIEYAISDGTVVSASLEVIGGATVNLTHQWNKWVGSTARIRTGTNVVVHATSSLGQTAKTQTFGYLANVRPETACTGACAPTCSGRSCGSDGCGGSCGACANGTTCESGSCVPSTCTWDPIWAQGSGANEWWIEYAISDGTVTSASLEVIGGATVNLTHQWNKWVGSTARIRTGTNVVVHAKSSLGQTAETQTFGYLANARPETACTGACTPGCSGRTCGSDGCGGSCGTCATGTTCESGSCVASTCTWNPTWQQGSGAGEWWIEYAISDGTVASAWLEVLGLATIQLRSEWNKWVGSTPRIQTGTPVVVHALSTRGQFAETRTFGYLADPHPATACGGACTRDCSGRNCGSDGCGATCGTCTTGTSCQSGSCVSTPTCGNGSCDGTETCSTCPRDCGQCPECLGVGEACGWTGDCCSLSCIGGLCTCPSTMTLCPIGICTDLMIDAQFCGSCDNRCPTGMACQAGSCVSAPP